MQTKKTINKLTDDLMQDLDDIRDGKLDSKTANSICRHSNTIMRTEDVAIRKQNIKLQYDRIEERVARNAECE